MTNWDLKQELALDICQSRQEGKGGDGEDSTDDQREEHIQRLSS